MNAQIENRTINRLVLDNDLIQYLKSKDNHKFSRYDAFVWLMEHILEAHTEIASDGTQSHQQEYLTTNTRLAKVWHWSRPTIQKSIEELENLSVITKQRCGNAYAFSTGTVTEKRIF